MKKVIKLKEQDLYQLVKRVMNEAKKTKKENDSQYDTWCKENGYEYGVGAGCADAALDSKESTIRSWGLGYLMGSKRNTLKEETDPYANKRYDPATDEWVVNKVEEMKDNRLVDYLRPLVDQGIIDSDVRDDILDLAGAYDKGEEYVDYDGEPLVNPTFDGPDVEYGDEEDERRYDDRENYGTDDESRYDERNYQYGNHPDDDYED